MKTLMPLLIAVCFVALIPNLYQAVAGYNRPRSIMATVLLVCVIVLVSAMYIGHLQDGGL